MSINVSDYLSIGAGSAKSGKELCALLGISLRQLTVNIERERRAGKPICSSTDGENPGYFLAANKAEMQRFCDSLHHRAGEIYKTRRACIKAMGDLPESEAV